MAAAPSDGIMDSLEKCVNRLAAIAQKTKLPEAEKLRTEANTIIKNIAYTISQLAFQAVSTTPETCSSYADATKHHFTTPVALDTKHTSASKLKPLFVKLNGNQEASLALEKIKQKIDPVTDNVTITDIKALNKKTIKILVADNDDQSAVRSKLMQQLPGSTVEEERKLQPRIIIFDVPSGRNDDRLLDEIYTQNSCLKENYTQEQFLGKSKIIRRSGEREIRGEKVCHLVIQITGCMYNLLRRANKNSINLAYIRRTWNLSDTYLRCRNCLRTGHPENQCRHKISCAKCGEEHETSACTTFTNEHCFLCSKLHNQKGQEAEHMLGDAKRCVTHKVARDRQLKRIDMTSDGPDEL